MFLPFAAWCLSGGLAHRLISVRHLYSQTFHLVHHGTRAVVQNHLYSLHKNTHTHPHKWFYYKAKLHHIWVQERSRFIMEYFRPKSQRAIKLTICLTRWEPQSYMMIWTLWQLHISMKLRWDRDHYEVKQKFLRERQLPSVSFWSCALHFQSMLLPCRRWWCRGDASGGPWQWLSRTAAVSESQSRDSHSAQELHFLTLLNETE